jgi:hypothetical protein
MFVAGTTGIMLWLPEMTSYVLPGWLIDVAAIVHSGQALPAAVFIFMVHFFNNHFVPGKFPMEMNIFTGRYPLEKLKRQHSMEYERIVADGRLEEVRCGVPGILTQFLASVFGLFCLALGIGLTILMFWAVFFY